MFSCHNLSTFLLLSILPISLASPFVVNSSGFLLTNEELDFERTTHFRFSILANDGGVPSRSASSSVSVKVGDVSDAAPKFVKTRYEVSLREEDENEGAEIVTIQVNHNLRQKLKLMSTNGTYVARCLK